MKKAYLFAVLALTLALAALSACKSKGAAAKFCLGKDGTSQDCGIACKVSKDKESCDKWAKMTTELCGKISKAECQEICDKDKNPTACELAKKMPDPAAPTPAPAPTPNPGAAPTTPPPQPTTP